MPDNLFDQPDNATPLRPEEAAELRVPVVDRRQLNEIEATNVQAGRAWALRSRKDCFTADYLCDLHKRMFGNPSRDDSFIEAACETAPAVEAALRANDGETFESLKFSLAGEGQSSWSCNASQSRRRLAPGQH